MTKPTPQTVRLPWIASWLKMTQNQVLDKFQGLPGSFTDGRDQKRFVFVEGTRKDKVLLVAHADTVFRWAESGGDSRIKLIYKDGIISTGNRNFEYLVQYGKNKTRTEKGIGIGADDRAGCGIVWNLRDLGHSLLITSGEECGCIATNWLMKNKYWRDKINKEHQFAVQFDRHGNNDIVFYDVGTDQFVEYVKNETGYAPDSGSTTDIRHLCKDICGVNMSVGYYDEHDTDETLNIKDFTRTLETARKWLSKPDIPKFELSFKNKYYHNFSNKDIAYGYSDDYDAAHIENLYDMQKTMEDAMHSTNQVDMFKRITCPDCKHEMLQELWFRSNMICEKCGKG